MVYSQTERNGVLDLNCRWHNATVPIYIEEADITDDEIKVILSVFKAYYRNHAFVSLIKRVIVIGSLLLAMKRAVGLFYRYEK